jgi:hypothetical protein
MGGALGLSILSGVAATVTAASAHLGATGALVHGFDRAMLVAMIFMLFAAALAVAVIRQPRKKPEDTARHGSKLHVALET